MRPPMPTPTLPDGASVREWLEWHKPGYAERYGAAFEALGLEDAAEVRTIDEEAFAAIEEQINRAAAIHLKRLRRALAAAGASLNEHPTPAMARPSPLAPSPLAAALLAPRPASPMVQQSPQASPAMVRPPAANIPSGYSVRYF